MAMAKSPVASGLSAILALFFLLAFPGADFAHATRPIESVEKVLNDLPPSALRKLSNKATSEEARVEINKHFNAHVLGQKGVIKTKVAKLEPLPSGEWKYRIGPPNEPVKARGIQIPRLTWFYFAAANVPPAGSVAVGAEITISGTIRRCEIVLVDGAPHLNFDLMDSKVEPSKPAATR